MTKHRKIYEYFILSILVLGFDILFIFRYGFFVTPIRILMDLFTLAIGISLISFISNRRWRYVLYTSIVLASFGFFLVDSTLYYYKKDITSFAMLIESFRDTMKIGIRYSPLEVFPLHIWLVIIVVVFVNLLILKNSLKQEEIISKKSHIRQNFMSLLIASFGFMVLSFGLSDQDKVILDQPNDKSRFIENYGSLTYHLKDLSNFATNLILPMIFAEEYYEELRENPEEILAIQSPFYGDSKDKNVIMIMCETCEEYGFSRLYTPNYYRLADASLIFNQFFSAAKSNYTYDAEFKSLTSMMYFESDNYMYTYGENTYQNALPWILRDYGYTTGSFHNFSGNFFNRKQIHPQLGFDDFYAMEDMNLSLNENWPLDSEMFYQMKDLIVPVQDAPFFSFIITVTSHGPFDQLRPELNHHYEKLKQDETLMDASIEHLTFLAAHMEFDQGLGVLLDDLESKMLLEDTVIILFSDHKNYSSPKLTEEYSGELLNPMDLDRVPLLIYIPGMNHEIIDTLGSHYDLTPTILDLLGIPFYSNYYYGESLFLTKRLDLPIILSPSTWITTLYRIINDQVVFGETFDDQIESDRMLVSEKIEFFKKLFITDFFSSHKTYK